MMEGLVVGCGQMELFHEVVGLVFEYESINMTDTTTIMGLLSLATTLLTTAQY